MSFENWNRLLQEVKAMRQQDKKGKSDKAKNTERGGKGEYIGTDTKRNE